MEDRHSLFKPLLHGNPTTTPLSTNDHTIHAPYSASNILIRFLSVIFVGILALYANHEASKGFDITIINDVKDSVAGQRFDLFYVSNDKATRIILDTSNFVERLLYPDTHNHPKKHINHVVLRLSSLNSTSNMGTIVHDYSYNKENDQDFTLHISTSTMELPNVNHALVTAIQRGMARVWLWEGGAGARAPLELIDGMVEYIRMVAEGSFGNMKSNSGIISAKLPECDTFWWKDKDPEMVAQMLNYCEGHSMGFIQRLNGAMKEKWHDRMVDDALGKPLLNLCGLYNLSKYSS